jgi:hypothetical protein
MRSSRYYPLNFNYLKEELPRGNAVGGRLAKPIPGSSMPGIQACLADPNQVRAYAAWALGIIGAHSAVDLRRLLHDPAR